MFFQKRHGSDSLVCSPIVLLASSALPSAFCFVFFRLHCSAQASFDPALRSPSLCCPNVFLIPCSTPSLSALTAELLCPLSPFLFYSSVSQTWPTLTHPFVLPLLLRISILQIPILLHSLATVTFPASLSALVASCCLFGSQLFYFWNP